MSCEFSNFELRMFNEAKKEAEKSVYKHFRLGCVITYKGHVIGRGFNSNKTHPMQKVYNRKYRQFNHTKGEYLRDPIHAELCAINSIKFTVGINVDWRKVKIFVYRICNGKPNGYGNAKPCPACMAAIRDLGIKDVFYTDDDGLGYLKLN